MGEVAAAGGGDDDDGDDDDDDDDDDGDDDDDDGGGDDDGDDGGDDGDGGGDDGDDDDGDDLRCLLRGGVRPHRTRTGKATGGPLTLRVFSAASRASTVSRHAFTLCDNIVPSMEDTQQSTARRVIMSCHA